MKIEYAKELLKRTTPGRWMFNSYRGIFSVSPDPDELAEDPEADGSLICETVCVPLCDNGCNHGDGLMNRKAQANGELLAKAPEIMKILTGAVVALGLSHEDICQFETPCTTNNCTIARILDAFEEL